jgi:hypothetical protein
MPRAMTMADTPILRSVEVVRFIFIFLPELENHSHSIESLLLTQKGFAVQTSRKKYSKVYAREIHDNPKKYITN